MDMSRVQFPLTFRRNQITMPKTVISGNPCPKKTMLPWKQIIHE